MAVLLAVSGPRHLEGFESPRLLNIGLTVVAVVYTLLASVAITIVGYGCIRWRKGFVFFHEPGHWLLVEISIHQLIYAALSLVERAMGIFLGREYADLSIEFAYSAWLVPGFLVLALNIYIGRTKCLEPYWSRVFYAKGAAALVPLIADFFVLLFLERAVRAENPRRVRMQPSTHQRDYVPPILATSGRHRSRDAAHWCGVVIQFIFSGLVVVLFFLGLLLFFGGYWEIFLS
jgi:hypothetical protein